MKAVILAGGLGTRLSEETDLKPKPMVEIGGKPILWHIMKTYSAHGVNDFVICCGYEGYVIKEYFANYFLHMSDVTLDMSNNSMEVHQRNAEPWRVTLVDTGDNTQTGGRLKRVKEYVNDEDAFCFTYGDGVSDVDVTALINFHRDHGKWATVTAVTPPGRYGALEREGDQVSGFTEKPRGDGGLINGGYFVLSPKCIDLIEGDSMPWESEPMSKLATQHQLMAFEHLGFWQPMDTLREKHLLQSLWDSGNAPLEILGLIRMQSTSQEFWRDKRVLVTGHTGFKGSWLKIWLQMLGVEVFGFALPSPTKPSLFEQAKLAEGMTSIIVDIRDFELIRKTLENAQPDIVIHMAAQPLVRYSYQEPIETYATNVMGTVQLLEAILHAGSVKAVVNITTDKCYENKEWEWGYRENEPMGGHDPYSSSKGCSELVTSAYRRSFYEQAGIALASARAGNVIGGGDWSTDRLVPDILRAFEAKKPVVIRSPNAIRPWQHVLEPLSGYLMLAQSLYEQGNQFSSAWNFGPNDDDVRPVQWIVEQMSGRRGEGASWILDDGDHPHEANYLKLDISKVKSQLGWKPIWNLNQALEKIIDWHKAWIAGSDMRSFCEQQIMAYQSDTRILHD